MTTIAVLGAGAVGLSTALQIKEALPRCQVKVVADKFDAETTSFGAAGIFHPDNTKHCKDVSRLHRWFGRSFDHYSQLLFSAHSHEAGISLLPFLGLMEKSQEQWEFLEKYTLSARRVSKASLGLMNLPGRYTSAFLCDTMLMEARYYLPFLRRRLHERNVEFETRRVDSADELGREVDLIVNCTGLGSRQLFNDELVHPERGQVFRVRAPWIRHAYLGFDHTYVIPTRETVVLGGTRQKDDICLELRESDGQDILRKTYEMIPSLKHAPVIEQWVGLRPARKEIRLEIDVDSCRVPVVHNYGHGVNGIALSQGTAVEAASLVQKALRASKL